MLVCSFLILALKHFIAFSAHTYPIKDRACVIYAWHFYPIIYVETWDRDTTIEILQPAPYGYTHNTSHQTAYMSCIINSSSKLWSIYIPLASTQAFPIIFSHLSPELWEKLGMESLGFRLASHAHIHSQTLIRHWPSVPPDCDPSAALNLHDDTPQCYVFDWLM